MLTGQLDQRDDDNSKLGRCVALLILWAHERRARLADTRQPTNHEQPGAEPTQPQHAEPALDHAD